MPAPSAGMTKTNSIALARLARVAMAQSKEPGLSAGL
jgi:hypothetical protein